jgi:hypothetical protein
VRPFSLFRLKVYFGAVALLLISGAFGAAINGLPRLLELTKMFAQVGQTSPSMQ